jgi:hypothetical protein
MNTINTLISALFEARTITHLLHLNTRSFARHMALGELYDTLNELADELAEMYLGTTDENIELVGGEGSGGFNKEDPIVFIAQLHAMLSMAKPAIEELHMPYFTNKYEELQGEVARVKYKLDRLH